MRMPETVVWNTTANQNYQIVPEGKRGFFICMPEEAAITTNNALFYSGTSSGDPICGNSFMFAGFRGWFDHSNIAIPFRNGLYGESDGTNTNWIVNVWVDTTVFVL